MKQNNSVIRTLLLIVICLAISKPAFNQTITVDSDITANTHWTADTVLITADIEVLDSITLTIDPGTYVQFQGFYEIDVKGTMIAKGLPGDTIVFTCHPDSSDSGWKGLVFSDRSLGLMFDNDSSVISYCRVEYGKPYMPLPGTPFGVITIWEFSRISITHSVFAHNHAEHGGAIMCREQANIRISHNHFYGNNSDYSGSAIYISSSEPEVTCNTFINNKGPLLVGGAAKILNNEFYGNSSYAMECYSNPLIAGNIICNNQRGMRISRSNALVVNNTICNNEYGIYCYDIMNPQFHNNIIWGNQNYQVEIGSIGSQPDFYYCNIQGGSGDFTGSYPYVGGYHNNLDVSPLFMSASSGSGEINYDPGAIWSLIQTSPCLNSGNPDVSKLKLPDKDIDDNPRIVYNRIDIGALEYQKDVIQLCGDITNDTTFLADTLSVECDVTILDNATLTILPGTIVEFQGHYWMKVFGTLIAEGNKSDTIIFTVNDNTGFEDKDTVSGGWGSLKFNNGSIGNGGADGAMIDNDTSIIKYCKFSYGKAVGTEWEEKLGGAIMIYKFSRIRIESCSFISNYAQDNGGALLLWTSDNLIVKSNTFINNRATAGGALYVRACQITRVFNNLFHNNFAPTGGAVYLSSSDNSEFLNNTFTNNSSWNGGAIRIAYSNNGSVINNLFSNNSSSNGGAIDQYVSAGFVFINNTITNNYASRGGGYYIHTSQPIIYNSIIRGNYPEEINIATLKSQPGINNSNIMGGSDAFGGEQFLGEYENNIDEDPSFNSPSAGAGDGYDGLGADWSVLPVSSCINKGRIDIPDVILPESDLAGNVRIHKDQIDLGAYENQSDAPVIILQPVNQFKCEGESVVLSVEVGDTANFRWKKDGIDLPGENEAFLSIGSLVYSHQGNYTCIVSNSFGSISTNTATVIVSELPEFLSEPGNRWAEKGKTVVQNTWAKGTNPNYQWKKNEVNIDGAISPEFIIPNMDYDGEGIYRCIVRNSCGADTTSPISLYLAPNLCMVTVDPATGNNLIIWEKSSIAPIDRYNIYRESQAAGIYDKLGTVAHEDLSIFADPTADPTVQAYLYKITGVDDSGFETDIDLCKPHKTIHLLVSTNPELNTTQLEWDRYYGFEYSTYNILRSETGSGFLPVHFLSSSLASWTDPEPLPETGFYRISVDKPEPCIPTGAGKKADSGPYSHSLSNVEDNRLQAGESPPDTIFLMNASINSYNRFGDLVGRLIAVDADSLDTHTWSLVPGEGDEGNLSFTVLGDLLLAAEVFDHEEQDEYSVRVRCKDEGNLVKEQVFSIHILGPSRTANVTKRQVAIYPNPFTHSTMIEFPNPDKEVFRMYITDLSGKVVYYEDNILNDQVEFIRNNLSAGVYFVEMRASRIHRGKLVIE